MTKRAPDTSTSDQSSSKRSKTSPPTSISIENQQTIITSTGSTAAAIVQLESSITDLLSRAELDDKLALLQAKFKDATISLLTAYCSHKRIVKGHNNKHHNLSVICCTKVAEETGLMTADEAITYVSGLCADELKVCVSH